MRHGHCPICDDPFISEKGRLLPNHKQYHVLLNTGDETYVAICSRHTPDDAMLADVTKQGFELLASETTNETIKNRYLTYEYERRLS